MGARLIRLLSGTRGPLAVASLAFALALPSLTLPRLLDDHGFRFRLAVQARGPQATFCFGEGAHGGFARRGPWWFDPDGRRFCFMRPLSGLSHWIDHRLWPDAVLWMRLQNCLLYAALAALALLGYQRFSGSGRAAALAGLMFAIDDAHAQVLGTVAGRNTLLWPALCLLALLAHDRQRSSPIARQAWAGPSAFALALLAGEGGVATLGYLVSYAVWLDRGTRAQRMRTLLPYLGVTAAWMAAYFALGYGAAVGDFYRDPRRDSLGALGSGLLDLPIWIASQLTLGFATATFEAPAALVRSIAATIVLLLAPLLYSVIRALPVARFYATGLVLSLAPLLLTAPQDRLLVLASFGGFGLLGCFIDRAADTIVPRAARKILIAVHLVIAPLAFMPAYLLTGRIARAEDAVDAALPRGDAAARTGAVIVHAPIIGSLGFALSKRSGLDQPLPLYSYELLAAPSALDVTRIDAHTLELEPQAGWCSSRAECIGVDPSRRYSVGQATDLSAMQVEIREVDARGMPKRVRFRFPSQLEDPSRVWLIWTAQGIEPFEPPPVGETLTLPALSQLAAFR